MDAHLQTITHLVLAHGDPQVSPQEVLFLNQRPMIVFSHNLDPSSEVSGYKVLLSGYAQHVSDNERGRRESGDLNDALLMLRATPYAINGKKLKGSVSTYSVLVKNTFRIDYQVHSGQVVVFNIQPVPHLQRLRDAAEQPGLYLVARNSYGSWRVMGKTDTVMTTHAAVNGQANNLTKAQWLMGSHLSVEFGDGVQEFSLFHNPTVGGYGDTWESVQDKLGFTTLVTRQFAAVLKSTQDGGKETYWVVHSQGGLIFVEGVRYLLNNHSRSALRHRTFNGIKNEQKGLLDKQRVAFHGNANNNWRSRRLLDRAGVELIAIRAHDYDFVTNILGANTANPRKLLGSVLYTNHVTRGSIVQSPHTLVQSQQQWEQNMITGPGKGRNLMQQGFHRSGKVVTQTVKVIKNYLP
ncbi:hypothetical protein G8770_03425 [Aestuariicella hydrocarbonica]|uniref:Uncharacterized protein n=1 Tax=Pseudomaricurvus hydrocarbonicus TaxID=1470433 RepID=A0A9E5MLT4_9GAMM|nr:hypothetical protein [Aestuariicella hydrocarbonica]NHO64595.1 hypothetical protein [Aestuariicella hydrocarbonica]